MNFDRRRCFLNGTDKKISKFEYAPSDFMVDVWMAIKCRVNDFIVFINIFASQNLQRNGHEELS